MWRRNLLDHLKNIPGQRSSSRMVAFAVDDYGNVRINGPQAAEKCRTAGLVPVSRFDRFDTLETREDLEALFEVLTRHRDQRGRAATFTPYAVSGNLEFETFLKSDGEIVATEPLTATFARLAEEFPLIYKGSWELWQQGMAENLLRPQFHGGEHFNKLALQESWKNKTAGMRTLLESHSLGYLKSSGHRGIYAAYEFEELDEIDGQLEAIKRGYEQFTTVFGREAVNFTPPNYSYHPHHLATLAGLGIKYIDTAMLRRAHLGQGKYKSTVHYQGQQLPCGLKAVIRNAVFEPEPNDGIDWTSAVLQQAAIAFFWNKPLLISTHRVDFCGWMDPDNRKQSLEHLNKLLTALLQRWPDIQFVGADEMCTQLFETT